MGGLTWGVNWGVGFTRPRHFTRYCPPSPILRSAVSGTQYFSFMLSALLGPVFLFVLSAPLG